jgi:hypothetical protein
MILRQVNTTFAVTAIIAFDGWQTPRYMCLPDTGQLDLEALQARNAEKHAK